MKNKKVVSTIVALGLVAAVGIGATLAAFQDQTGDITNTFTVGNVDITVTEPDWDPEQGKDLYPNAEVDKNPMITNTGENEGYMMMSVAGMNKMAKQGFSATVNTEKWTLVDKNGTPIENAGTELVDGYYVYKDGALAIGDTTAPLFTSVKYNPSEDIITNAVDVIGKFVKEDGTLVTKAELEAGTVKASELKKDAQGKYVIKYTVMDGEEKVFDTYADAEAYVKENMKETSTTIFDLVVKGYAVQTKGVTFQDENGNYVFVEEFKLA